MINSMQLPCVVSIAGTDPTGGAGIGADIKAISATGAYAAFVITALVAQNTQGVQAIEPVSTDFVRQQMDSVFSDLTIKAVKIGMLHDARMMDVVFSELAVIKPPNVVLDPVMVAKDGSLLLRLESVLELKKRLTGVVHLITPNLTEAEYLLEERISSVLEMEAAAIRLGQQLQVNVLIKGGHLTDQAPSDVLYEWGQDRCHWFHSERILTKNTHGTGCSLSAAIASYLAQGVGMIEAIQAAKQYLTKAIQSGATQQIGHGNGPVDHFYFLNNRN